MNNLSKIIAGVCLLLTACNNQKDKSNATVIVKPRHIDKLNYIVKNGDTIESVALSHGMRRSELININELTPPYDLYEGQKLIVKNIENKSIKNFAEDSYSKESNEIADNLNSENLNSENKSTKIEIVQEGGMKTETEYEPSQKIEEVFLEDEDINKVEKYIWPVEKAKERISQHYTNNDTYVMINTPGGTPVKAIADGEVRFAGKPKIEGMESYKNMVIIKHKEQRSVYAILESVTVKVGQKIKKGDTIGTVGTLNKKPQLYLSIQNIVPGKKAYSSVDPEKILP